MHGACVLPLRPGDLGWGRDRCRRAGPRIFLRRGAELRGATLAAEIERSALMFNARRCFGGIDLHAAYRIALFRLPHGAIMARFARLRLPHSAQDVRTEGQDGRPRQFKVRRWRVFGRKRYHAGNAPSNEDFRESDDVDKW